MLGEIQYEWHVNHLIFTTKTEHTSIVHVKFSFSFDDDCIIFKVLSWEKCVRFSNGCVF